MFRGINACSAGQRHCRVAAYQVECPEKFSSALLGGRTWGYGMCRGARCGHVTMWARGRVMLRLSLRLLSDIRRKSSCAPLRRSLSTLSFTKPAALANLLRTTADAFSAAAARVHKLRSYPDSHRSTSGRCVAECVSRDSCLNAILCCSWSLSSALFYLTPASPRCFHIATINCLFQARSDCSSCTLICVLRFSLLVLVLADCTPSRPTSQRQH